MFTTIKWSKHPFTFLKEILVKWAFIKYKPGEDTMKTKEKILIEALDLFASDGYEAVSVQNIADRIGITKGALYKHYKNKRDILDCIVERMRQNKLERAKEYNLDEIYPGKDSLNMAPIEQMIRYVEDEFTYWTQNEFASNFRKMLTLEQYRDWEMSYLYQSYLTKGVITFIEDYFSVMMTDNIMETGNPKTMAMELYSPVFILISMYDVAEDKMEIEQMLNEHLLAFAN